MQYYGAGDAPGATAAVVWNLQNGQRTAAVDVMVGAVADDGSTIVLNRMAQTNGTVSRSST